MARFLIVLLIIFGTMFFIVYQFASFLLGTKSVKRKIEKDKQFFFEALDDLMDGLVDVDHDELKIMGVSPVSKSVNQGVSTFEKGVLSTIYQEPIVAYTSKLYNTSNTLLLTARTSDHVYYIKSEGESFKVFRKDRLIGTISDDYQFDIVEHTQDRIMAEKHGSKSLCLKQKGKELAHLNLRNEKGGFDSDRVFSLFHDFKSGNEEELLLLAIFHILIKPKLVV